MVAFVSFAERRVIKMKYEEELKYLQQQFQYFKEQAELDLLTKLYNRMSFEKYVNAELEKNRGRRENKECCRKNGRNYSWYVQKND